MATTQARRFDLSRDDGRAAREAAVAALRRGELVVVPTETVYGVAAAADVPAGRARLDALKGDRRRPYSVAVDGLSLIESRLAPLPLPALRMAERWWPGPVTQVLVTTDGSTLGVRVPGRDWTRELVADLAGPLLLPSANPTGAPPPVEVGEIDPRVLEHVTVVVDGGRAALGESSTVVRPSTACLRVLREGVVSRKDLSDHALGRILVVCSGNTCRSPMAAALLARELARRQADDPQLLSAAVESAGIYSGGGSPASAGAVSALAARGLDLSAHVSSGLQRERLAGADLVLGMTVDHVRAAAALAGDLGFPIELFDPSGEEVEDPFGGPPEVYAACADRLERMAAERAAVLCPPAESPS